MLTYTAVLAGAGNETTGRLIGWLAKLLAEHPDQRREVVEDRSLIPNVIDEALRFEPTGHASARYVMQDVDYYGTTDPGRQRRSCCSMASANRDPRRYTDPDVFDIHREDIQHLTFGFGLHFCLGASLARLEGRVALDELLNRFPEWDVDSDGMKLAPTSTVRGWERMPIVLPDEPAEPDDGPVVVVSNDTHIGPRLVEDLRAVLPARAPRRLRPVRGRRPRRRRRRPPRCSRGSGYLDHPNFRTPGHHDSAARLADYDHDGIAAGVMFHGSMNMEPIPFIAPALGKPTGLRRPRARRRSACGSTTGGSPTSCRRHRTATSGSPTCRCGTSTPPSPRSSGRATPACGASTSRRCATASCPSTTGGSGSRCGRRARSSACRSSPTSAAPPTPATPGSKAWPSCRSSPAGSPRAGRCGG